MTDRLCLQENKQQRNRTVNKTLVWIMILTYAAHLRTGQVIVGSHITRNAQQCYSETKCSRLTSRWYHEAGTKRGSVSFLKIICHVFLIWLPMVYLLDRKTSVIKGLSEEQRSFFGSDCWRSEEASLQKSLLIAFIITDVVVRGLPLGFIPSQQRCVCRCSCALRIEPDVHVLRLRL